MPKPMPELPRPGQQVRWRNAAEASVWGWQDVFGAGPFQVLGLIDHGDQSRPTGLVLHTEFGDQEISELWLALADEPEEGAVPARENRAAPIPKDVVGHT